MDGCFITELMATDSDISMAFPHIFTKLPETQLFKTEPIQLYLFESKAKQIQQM